MLVDVYLEVYGFFRARAVVVALSIGTVGGSLSIKSDMAKKCFEIELALSGNIPQALKPDQHFLQLLLFPMSHSTYSLAIVVLFLFLSIHALDS